ncbi:molybdopterin converting factor subunit 1 [Sphingomonas morindae]|uniref:Molybdopterin converting factor subunit 1 n=1 Tax=Sphingomonas morindae TaxID=1541170 RepID=A0ABY4X378_9SPHN|nr:molybdopterin converting factor subunit 1 [Sphingomonas morindae]USI71384.1 molybdopterin converting factor subunit 1 [Sphingomonas morindae]
MTLTILYFAWVREKIGRDGEALDVPAGIMDVAGVVGWLASRGGGYAEALGDLARLRYALDQAFVGPDAPLDGARELAIFPPVTGG